MLDFLAQHADAIFTAGSVGFIIALVPMVRAKEKPPARASVQTASILSCFSLTYVALGLPFAAVTSAITAVMWWCLASQALGQRTGHEIGTSNHVLSEVQIEHVAVTEEAPFGPFTVTDGVEFTGAEQAVVEQYDKLGPPPGHPADFQNDGGDKRP